MRPDMFHLIVERPRLVNPKRAGSHYPRGSLRARFERDLEDAPSRLGMSFPHREKWLNENLAPLRRFLRAQVGRPWNKVRSEIRAVVDARSATKLHILEHLDDFVEVHVVMIEGRPHRLRWGVRVPIVASARGAPLWVCPRSGLLRLPPRARPVATRFGRALRLGPTSELREIDGRWTFVTLAPLPAEPAERARCVDALVGPLGDDRWFGAYRPRFEKTFGRKDAFAVATREPGRRELARVTSGRRKSMR
jgi:hypothetical protein